MAKVHRMGTDPMIPLIIKYSLPAIAGLLVTALYGFVDGVFIGIGVGDAGIAATTVAMPFMVVTAALNTLIGNGGNIVASIRLGQGRPEEAERSLGNAIFWMALVWVILLVTCIPLIDPILQMCGATPESYELAKQYLTIMIIGFLAGGLSGGIGNYVRTAGSPNIIMAIMIIASVANIALDYVAVLVLHYGVVGAAWATVIAQLIGAALTFVFFTRKTAAIRFRFKYLRPTKEMTKQIFKLGLPGFFMNALGAITSVIINQLFIYYGNMEAITGTGALAAYGASGRVQSLFFQVAIGVTIAAQPILGYNWGAQYLKRVKACFWDSANITLVALIVMTILIETVPQPLMSLFGLTNETFDFAIYTIRVMSIMLPVGAYGMFASTYFMATEQALKANILVLLRQIILLIPFLLLNPIMLPAIIGCTPTESILWAWPMVDVVSTVVSMLMVIKDLKKLQRRIDSGDTNDPKPELQPAEQG